MATDQATVRITIDQLARLVRQLAYSEPAESELHGYTPQSVGAFNVIMGASTVFLQANQYRKVLILSCVNAGPAGVWLSDPTSFPQGIALALGADPVVLTYKDLGNALTGTWRANAAVINTTITWGEISGTTPG